MFSRLLTRYGFLIWTICTIAGNALIEILRLWWETSATISDRLPTLITPAGFTFSIWLLIYTALLIVGVMIAMQKIRIDSKAALLYLFSCCANVLWLVVWHYWYVALSVIVIVCLLFSIFFLVSHLRAKHENDTLLYKVLMIYFWWILLATLICVTAYLSHFAPWFSSYILVRSVACLIWAWALNSVIMAKEQTILTACVLLWALYGIAVAQSNQIILITSLVVWVGIFGYILYLLSCHVKKN